MPENIYEIVALGARYWFALLGVLIVWRSFHWLRRDRREKHRRLRQLPDAGMIGEMVVLSGGDELPEGNTLPVPREGTLGYVRGCDLVVPVDGVARQHCDFSFRNGDGLLIYPRRGCQATVDGEIIRTRRDARQHPMQHGSSLQVGAATLRLRVFMGLECERPAQILPDEEAAPAPPPELPEHWQDTPTIYHQVPAQWQEPLPPYGPGCSPPAMPGPAQPFPEPPSPDGADASRQKPLGRRDRREHP